MDNWQTFVVSINSEEQVSPSAIESAIVERLSPYNISVKKAKGE